MYRDWLTLVLIPMLAGCGQQAAGDKSSASPASSAGVSLETVTEGTPADKSTTPPARGSHTAIGGTSNPPGVVVDPDVPPEIVKGVSEHIALKAEALKNATVQIHRAYLYRGPTDLVIDEKAKLIAVEIGVGGYTQNFKIWDIDIIDGDTNENFGSDPDVAFLDSQGKFVTFDGDRVDFTKPPRLMLVYGVPPKMKSIKLGYWGKDLMSNPIPLDQSGPPLPQRP